MKTLDQEMAGKVYNKVSEYAGRYGKDSPERKKYGSMAHKLPILIRTAGLAEALAFTDSRKKDPIDSLLNALAEVVSSDFMPFQNKENLLSKSRSADLQDYMYLTRRSMLALKWFKRFAQSILEVDVTDDAEGG